MGRRSLRLTVVLTTAFAVFTGTYSIAQSKTSVPIKDIEIKQKFVDTPQINGGNVSQYNDPKMKWLNIEVTYVTEAPKGKDATGSNWLDDFSIQYDVLIKTVYKGQEVPALLMGTVRYWSVEMNGDKHYAEAFIHPLVLRRYMDPGTKLKGNAAEKIYSRVTFYDKNKRPIARSYNIPKGATEDKVRGFFKSAEDSLGVLRVEDIVFPRTKTPWSVLNTDRYEVIKDSNK